MKEQGLGTFQFLNTMIQKDVVKEWVPYNAKQHLTNKVLWQSLVDAKDKVLEAQRKEEMRLQGMGDQGNTSRGESTTPADNTGYSLSLPMGMGGGIRPAMATAATKTTKGSRRCTMHTPTRHARDNFEGQSTIKASRHQFCKW